MKSHWRVFNIHAEAPFPAAPVLKIVVVLGGGGGVSFFLPTRVKSRVFIRASNEGNEVSNNTLLTSFVTLRIRHSRIYTIRKIFDCKKCHTQKMSHSPGIVYQTSRSIRSIHCPHFYFFNSKILVKPFIHSPIPRVLNFF